MSHAVAVRAERLTKTLGARKVLRALDLTIHAGECVVLRGHNGTGKTTLLRCLAGLVRPDAGHVSWFGRSPAETAAHGLIGMVAHESHLYPHLTLRENLVLAGRLQGVAGPTLRADRWLEAAGLHDHSRRLPREVSQGMRRRTSIARAMLHDPPLLLLDEPFSSLDQSGRSWLAGLLRDRYEQGQTTCLVTHETATAPEVAGRVLELRAGSLWETDEGSSGRNGDAPASVNVPAPGRHEEVAA
jgi:heme ABC exporter ATP-binding subunit CcmA